MARRRSRETTVFSISFLDVLANTVGGLTFLLIMAVLLAGVLSRAPSPVVSTEELPPGYRGKPYRTWLAAREGLGRFEWSFGQGAPPAGLLLDPVTGELTGIPQLPGGVGEHEYEFEVICAVEESAVDTPPPPDVRRFSMVVYRDEPVPTIPLRITTPAELPECYVDAAYPLQFGAEGGQPPYRWTASDLPRGLTLLGSGLLSGAPAAVGTYRLQISVASANGERGQGVHTLVVSTKHPPPPPVPPLSVLTNETPDAVAGRPYVVWLSAEGGAPPYVWTQTEGPSWLSNREASARFAGTPPLGDVGSVTSVWQVTDGAGRTATSPRVEWAVLPPTPEDLPPLMIHTTSLPDLRAGTAVRFAASAEGGVAPYQWSWTGELPPGLSWEGGILAGTPTSAARVGGRLTVVDRTETRQSVQLAIVVRPELVDVVLLTSRLPDAQAGSRYSTNLAATGGFPPYAWSLASGDLPPGLILSQDGEIVGVPTEAGEWHVQIGVRDAEGSRPPGLLSARLLVRTEQHTLPLRIATRSLPVLLTGTETDLALAAEGGQPPYDWAAGSLLPEGVEIRGGSLVGTPSQEFRRGIEVRLTDAVGQTASAKIPLRVRRVISFRLFLLLAALLLLALILLLILFLRLRKTAKLRNPPELRILTEEIPNARASCDYSVQLACMGGAPPYRWSLAEGTPPTGLALTEDGRIEGRPFEGIAVDTTKEVRFTVRVRDAVGNVAEQTL